MLLKKNTGVSCCDVAAATSSNLSVIKRTGTCTASRKSTAPESISPCQLARRNAYKELTSLWNSATPAQKTGWLTLANATPFLNACSEVFFLSAFNMFSRVNGVLLAYGIEFMLIDAPLNYNDPSGPLPYTTDFRVVPYSALKPLVLNFGNDPVRGLSIFSHKGTSVPTSYEQGYFKLLSAGELDFPIGPGAFGPETLTINIGLRHAYRHGYDSFLGLCGLGPTSTYDDALNFISDFGAATFMVRTVDMSNGAHTEVTFESAAIQ